MKTKTEYFNDFLFAKRAQGTADKTIPSYNYHINAVKRHLDVNVLIEELNKSKLNTMINSIPKSLSLSSDCAKVFISR